MGTWRSLRYDLVVNPPVSQNTLLIPALGTPVIDPKTGKMTREWYRYFTLIGTAIGPDPSPIPDQPAALIPPPTDVLPGATDGDFLGTGGFAAQAIGMIQDLQQQISDLQQSSLPPAVVVGLVNMLANAHIFVGNGSGIAADVAVSGDLTLADTGAFTIVTIDGQPLGTFATQLIGMGTATNDSAAAGYIGEEIESVVTSASPVAFATSGVPQNLTSILLSDGDWDVEGIVSFNPSVGTSTTAAGFNDTTGTLPALELYTSLVVASTGRTSCVMARRRISLAAPTTIFAVGQAVFPSGTCSMYGFINARRPR